MEINQQEEEDDIYEKNQNENARFVFCVSFFLDNIIFFIELNNQKMEKQISFKRNHFKLH